MDEMMSQTHMPKISSTRDVSKEEKTDSDNFKSNVERSTNCEISEEVDLKTFASPHPLKVHMLIHTKEKPYVCEICSKTFRHLSQLKSHLRTHTKEKPYVCEICSKAFSLRGTLKTHLIIHTKEKLGLICEICNKAFAYKGLLKSHLLSAHTNHVCEICSKAFTLKSSLNSHLITHTKEKRLIVNSAVDPPCIVKALLQISHCIQQEKKPMLIKSTIEHHNQEII